MILYDPAKPKIVEPIWELRTGCQDLLAMGAVSSESNSPAIGKLLQKLRFDSNFALDSVLSN